MNLETIAKWAGPYWRVAADWLQRVDWRAWVAWRRLRWLLLVPVVLIALLVLLPFLIPVSVYKDKIVEQVRLATGRELKIDGDLRLSFWPAFGVRVEKVSFANAPGAAEPQMATMDAMVVGAELLPLMSGSLRVTEVRFVKPVIHLETDAQGRGNWLLEPAGGAATTAPATPAQPAGDVSFADARIEDGVLTYRDARTGTSQRIDGIDVVVALPSLDQPMTVDGALTWNKEKIDVDVAIADPRGLSAGRPSGLTLKVGGEVLDASFDGTFDAPGSGATGNIEFGTASVKRLAAWVGANAPVGDKLGAIKLVGAVTIRPDIIALKDAKFSALDDALQATFTGTVDAKTNAIAGLVDAKTESARDLAKRAGAALPGNAGFGPAALNGSLSITPGRVAFNNAKLSVDGDLLRASFTGILDTASGKLAGSLDARSSSARRLASQVGATLPGARGFEAATFAGSVSTSPGRVVFKDARLSVDGDVLRTSFTGTLETATGSVAGLVNLTSSSARELAARAGFQLPGTRGFAALAVNGSLRSSPGRLSFSDAKLSVDGDVLNANFTGVVEAEAHKIAGTVNMRSSSARELAARAGFALPGGAGFGPVAISGAFASTPERIVFDNARIALDGSNGTGDLTLTTTSGRSYAKGTFTLDRLDLNPYAGSNAGPKSSGGAIAPWSDNAIDFSALNAIDADLAFATDALHAGGLRIGRSELDFALKGGTLRASLKKMVLYGGSGTGAVTLSGGSSPQVAADITLASINAEPLLTDWAGFNRLSGTGNITLKVSSAGRSQRALMSALDGTVQIKLEDGAVNGANLAEVARTIQSVVSGGAIGSSAKTDFAELSASLAIKNGVGRNDDLRLLNPFVRLSGAGTVDVANQRLDYRVEPRAVRSAEGQGGKQDLRGVGIPFLIKGPWSKLAYSPDLSGVMNTTIDSIIKGEDPIKGVKEQLGLDELFGKKKKPTTPAPAEPPAGTAPPENPPQPAPQQPPAQPAEPQPQEVQPSQPGASEPGVPPNPQQDGTEPPKKPEAKRKVEPVDVLKGLFGQ